MNLKKDSKSVVQKIKETTEDIHNKIKQLKQPQLKIPLRALSNVKYD